MRVWTQISTVPCARMALARPQSDTGLTCLVHADHIGLRRIYVTIGQGACASLRRQRGGGSRKRAQRVAGTYVCKYMYSYVYMTPCASHVHCGKVLSCTHHLRVDTNECSMLTLPFTVTAFICLCVRISVSHAAFTQYTT